MRAATTPPQQGGAFLATSTVVWRPEARGQIICAESHVTMMYLGDHFVFSLFCGFSFSFGIVFVLHPVTSILYKKTYDAFVNWWWLIFLCSHASSLLSDQWLITRLARKILLFPRTRKNLKSCTEWNHGADPVIMVLMHGHLWPCGLWEVFYQDGLWKMRAVDVCGRSSALLSQHCLEVNCTGVPAPAGFGCGVSFNSFSDPIFGHSRVFF